MMHHPPRDAHAACEFPSVTHPVPYNLEGYDHTGKEDLASMCSSRRRFSLRL
jgi:hypothetical protein